MPATLRTPGVYIQEIPSGVRPITGVSTSDTAFVDFFPRGPLDEPARIGSWGDFLAQFGGLDPRSEASYAIQQYYLNGGNVAWVVRVASGANAASLTVPLASGPGGGASGASGASGSGGASLGQLTFSAATPGAWGNNLEVGVDLNVAAAGRFNLVVRERVVDANGKSTVRSSEVYRNLVLDQTSPDYAVDVINADSALLKASDSGTIGGTPGATGGDVINAPRKDFSDFRRLGASPGPPGTDGAEPGSAAWDGGAGALAIQGDANLKTGLHALDRIAPNAFNILCLPALAGLPLPQINSVLSDALAYCEANLAFLIVDPPKTMDALANDSLKLKAMDDFRAFLESSGLRHPNAAVYFPRLVVPDEVNGFRPRKVGPSGTMAGVFSRTDAGLGVWKAPAGTDAVLRRADVDVKLNDDENGGLNPFGINALRTFPVYGNIAWGARTLEGADQLSSENKYIPVRRTALFIEMSLRQGLKWVVFQPNDEPLWAQIKLNATTFMQGLFRQRAFQGASPAEAYLVKCDHETTTQADVDLGRVNILIGFAPLKPAEFVVIQIQQLAGQASA